MDIFERGKEETLNILEIIRKKKLVSRYLILILSLLVGIICTTFIYLVREPLLQILLV